MWNEFSWACFLFHAWNSNDAYIGLMTNLQFTDLMWTATPQLDADGSDYVARCVVQLLGRYGCHTPNNDDKVAALANELYNSTMDLQALFGRMIDGLNFDEQVDNRTVRQVTEQLYQRFNAVPHIGPTATGKLLHILRPWLFVMWDEDIRHHYAQECPAIGENAQGYSAFLKRMQGLAEEVNQAFEQVDLAHEGGPAGYLSAQLRIDPPKTLAKYIDEYNWVTITKGVQVPPAWYPDM